MKKEIDFSKGKRGDIVNPLPDKVRITIRLDQGVVTTFKKAVHEVGGGSYQTLINTALLEHIAQQKGDVLEKTLRRVIREALQTASEQKAISKKRTPKQSTVVTYNDDLFDVEYPQCYCEVYMKIHNSRI